MTVSPFRDYSDVLVPLPSLNEGSATNSPVAPGQLNERRFIDILGPLVSESGEIVPETPAENANNNSRYFNYAAPNRVANLPSSDYRETDELTLACKEVEGFLLGLLLKNMGSAFGRGGIFSKSFESGYYQNMFYFEIARMLSTSGPGIGIAERLRDDIIMKDGSIA
ncbi:MAG TPA: hypothetical protein ENN67_06885 [Firmicutes bacterium]|nr:hypothetical protein [Bacillota bacterium]